MNEASLREEALRAGRTRELESQGYVGGFIRQGWTTRIVVPRGRGTDDVVVFQPDSSARPWEQAEPAPLILSRQPFDPRAATGATIISERAVALFGGDGGVWVDGALSLVSPVGAHGTELGDLEFWPVMSSLGARYTEESLFDFRESVLSMPSDVADEFAGWLGRKLRAAADARIRLPGEESAGTEPDVVDWEIVARGKRVLHRNITTPRSERLARRRGVVGLRAFVFSELPAFAQAAEAASQVEPRDNQRPPGVFSLVWQRQRLGLDPWEAWTTFAFIGYAVGEGKVRELRGLVLGHSVHGARVSATAHLSSSLQGGESLHPSVMVWRTGLDGVAKDWPMLTVHWKLPVSEFRARRDMR